jgi:predicted AlkP superfamily pyrophosphatase or phosphodiesterase
MRLRRAFPILLLACPAFAQSARRAVLFDLDGVRRDTFEQAWRDGKLPNFGRIFGAAVWFDHATTVTPPVTMAAQASIATGTPPVRHGIPGNRWYDRTEARLYDYMNTTGISCTYGFSIFGGQNCLAGLGNRHLQVPTMYEAARSHGFDSVVAYNQYWKGAMRAAPPTAAEARAFLPGNKLDFRSFDTQMTARAVRELQERGLPAILTVYFTGADTIGHSDGIAAQFAYLAEVIDPLAGRILDAIAALDPDWRIHTLFLLTSDHGRTDAVSHPEDANLQRDLEAALPAGAHLAQNGGIAYIYLDQPDPALPAALQRGFASTIASVRATAAGDPARAGDLIVTLRPGHYFGNLGKGSHHGAPVDGDLDVPLLAAMPGASGGHLPDQVSVTQIARTIADFVGFPMEGADPPLPLIREMRRR